MMHQYMSEFAFVPLDSDLRLQRYAQGLKNKYTQRLVPNASSTAHAERLDIAKTIRNPNHDKDYAGYKISQGFERNIREQGFGHDISPLTNEVNGKKTTVGLIKQQRTPMFDASPMFPSPYKHMVDVTLVGHPSHKGAALPALSNIIQNNPSTEYNVSGLNDTLNHKYKTMKGMKGLRNMSLIGV